MVLKLYCDLMSQPSRTVYLLLKRCNIPFEHVELDVVKRTHLSSEYSQVNRLKKFPTIEKDGFILTETNAIMRYLRRLDMIPESYYPLEIRSKARVDEFLEWQYMNFRLPVSVCSSVKFIEPVYTGKLPEKKRLESNKKRLVNALKDLEKYWLTDDKRFVVGDTLTVADLLAICEVETHRRNGYDLSRFPQVESWSARVRDQLQPEFEEAHARLDRYLKTYAHVIPEYKD